MQVAEFHRMQLPVLSKVAGKVIPSPANQQLANNFVTVFPGSTG